MPPKGFLFCATPKIEESCLYLRAPQLFMCHKMWSSAGERWRQREKMQGEKRRYVIEQLDGQHLETPENIDRDRGQLIIHDQRQFLRFLFLLSIQLDLPPHVPFRHLLTTRTPQTKSERHHRNYHTTPTFQDINPSTNISLPTTR
jgi:hypothetical protein